MKRAIYQAGPLFTEAEKGWHRALSAQMEKAGHHVIWPGDLLTDEAIKAVGKGAPALIFDACKTAIDRCDTMVALLDGAQVDDGTAWEIGYAYAKGMPIYGIRTDFRCAGDTPFNSANSMIEGCLKGFARSVESLMEQLQQRGE